MVKREEQRFTFTYRVRHNMLERVVVRHLSKHRGVGLVVVSDDANYPKSCLFNRVHDIERKNPELAVLQISRKEVADWNRVSCGKPT